MRIFVLFAIFLGIGGEVNQSDDIDVRAQKFINERIIPILKRNGRKNITYENIHMCHCSKTTGCDARTTGWVPNITELTFAEKAFWKDTCYTDGSCYQKVQPFPELTLYGCFDGNRGNTDTDFHDTAENVCQNGTSSRQVGAWICCQKGNWCANQTNLELPPVPTPPLSGWVIPTGISLVCTVGIIAILIHFCGSKIRAINWLLKKHCSFRAESLYMEPEQPAEEMAEMTPKQPEDTQEVLNLCQTQSTFASGIDFSMLPPNLVKIMNVLEETSGSGAGQQPIREKTFQKRITLGKVLGTGRYGNVHYGEYFGDPVAVKVFRACDEIAFLQEFAIYRLRMLRHNNILRFMGTDRTDAGNTIQLWIMTEYMEHGALYDYLQRTVFDLKQFYVLMRSAASGLAFLHTALNCQDDDSFKPSIAHRDIKSKNIMVRADGTCAIGDFGLCIIKENRDGKMDPTKVHSKCGTVRYLPPEVLDDTMQIEQFDSYQRADVYSFSIVMWEVLSRVSDGDVEAKPPSECIPYFHWIPRDPSDAKLKEIVVEKKFRPKESRNWRTHPEIRKLLRLIQSCWGEHPPARLTAMAIKMRLQKLQLAYLESLNPPKEVDPLAVAFSVENEEVIGLSDMDSHDDGEDSPLPLEGIYDQEEQAAEKPTDDGFMGVDDSKDPLLR